jgi:hypothetical protein
MSLQVQQSAINNLLEQLKLDGRKFDLPELFALIAHKLDRPDLAKLDDLPENVHVTFADKDAVRVRCEADRMEVILSFAELTELNQGKLHRWRDFTVRTRYRPEAHGLDARFVRGSRGDEDTSKDGTIFLEGKSLKGKPLLGLRAIFSKVLARNRPINLLSEKITHDARIQDLQITQFTVEDGWIALAYGQHRGGGNVARKGK